VPDEGKPNPWQQTYTWVAENCSPDGFLSLVETITVVVIAVVIYGVITYEFLWVAYGIELPSRPARLEAALKTFNENWKLGLLLLIPLFFRTIRKFMERVEEVAGMKARAPETQPKEVPNPPQQGPN